jgi:hypothetical protein
MQTWRDEPAAGEPAMATHIYIYTIDHTVQMTREYVRDFAHLANQLPLPLRGIYYKNWFRGDADRRAQQSQLHRQDREGVRYRSDRSMRDRLGQRCSGFSVDMSRQASSTTRA